MLTLPRTRFVLFPMGFLLCFQCVHAEIVMNDSRIEATSDADMDFLVLGEDAIGFYFHPDTLERIPDVGGVLTPLFSVSEGDMLTQSVDSDFPRIRLQDIPTGESFVGFAFKEDAPDVDSWHGIGWIRLNRGEKLEVVCSATSYGFHNEIPPIDHLTPSPGITVGLPVPEPSSRLLLGIFALVCLPIRRCGRDLW